MELSPEILGLVLSLLRKGDLKKVRLVSKAWEKAAVPYLFDQVFMSQSYDDLSIAEMVIDQFGYHLKILTFSAVYHKALSRTEFDTTAKLHVPRNMMRDLDRHLQCAYDN